MGRSGMFLGRNRTDNHGFELQAEAMKWVHHMKSLPRLLQALLALAVLVAPVTANAMEPVAASSTHHQETKASSHCTGAPDGASKNDKRAGKTCCASMCMGVAVAPRAPAAGNEPLLQVAPTTAVMAFLLSSPAELATPPPRSA